MEPLTQSLVWCIVQVTLIAALAWLLCWALARWTGPTTALVPAAALAAIVALTACAFAPWPSWWRYGPSWQVAAMSVDAAEEPSRSRLPGRTSADAELNEPQADSAEPRPLPASSPPEPAAPPSLPCQPLLPPTLRPPSRRRPGPPSPIKSPPGSRSPPACCWPPASSWA